MSHQGSPITILAGEALEPYRRILFNGTSWVYADANEQHQAVTIHYVASGALGEARTANDPGIMGIESATTLTAGNTAYAADDGKVTSTSTGLVVGLVHEAPIAASNPAAILNIDNRPGLLYGAVAASATLASLAAETAFDKSYTLPANSLKVGDVIDIWAQVDITAANSTDTFLFKIKIGSTILAATGTIDGVTGDVAVIHARAKVRTIGASGTIVAASLSYVGTASSAAGAADIPSGSALASTTIDTTATQAITVTATHSTNSAGNQSTLQMLDVMVLRKAA